MDGKAGFRAGLGILKQEAHEFAPVELGARPRPQPTGA